MAGSFFLVVRAVESLAQLPGKTDQTAHKVSIAPQHACQQAIDELFGYNNINN